MVRFFSYLAVCLALATGAFSQNAEIEATIESQLQAFLQDDFAEAFDYADETIKRIFETPERFGQMVTNGYPMVHRPKTYEFQDLREVAGGLYQNVLIEDQLGNLHIVEYAMQATPDGWKIRGVQVLRAPEVNT